MENSTLQKWLLYVGAGVATAWARVPWAMQTLVLFGLADLAIGAIGALVRREFRAHLMFQGLMKKIAAVIVLLVAYRLEVPQLPFDVASVAGWTLCFYELTSLMENYGKFRKVPPIYTKVIERLRALTGEADSGGQ